LKELEGVAQSLNDTPRQWNADEPPGKHQLETIVVPAFERLTSHRFLPHAVPSAPGAPRLTPHERGLAATLERCGMLKTGIVWVPPAFLGEAGRWVVFNDRISNLRAIRRAGAHRHHYNIHTDIREAAKPRFQKGLAAKQAKGSACGNNLT
jgi:hypothetical protein